MSGETGENEQWLSKHADPYRAPEVTAELEEDYPTLPHERKRWNAELGRFETWAEVHGAEAEVE